MASLDTGYTRGTIGVMLLTTADHRALSLILHAETFRTLVRPLTAAEQAVVDRAITGASPLEPAESRALIGAANAVTASHAVRRWEQTDGQRGAIRAIGGVYGDLTAWERKFYETVNVSRRLLSRGQEGKLFEIADRRAAGWRKACGAYVPALVDAAAV